MLVPHVVCWGGASVNLKGVPFGFVSEDFVGTPESFSQSSRRPTFLVGNLLQQLASCLFETVWIQDKKLLAVTPRPEFKPFFDLQYAGMSHYMLQVRPRGDSNP